MLWRIAHGEVEAGCLDDTLAGHEADSLVALCPAYDHARVLRAATQAMGIGAPITR